MSEFRDPRRRVTVADFPGPFPVQVPVDQDLRCPPAVVPEPAPDQVPVTVIEVLVADSVVVADPELVAESAVAVPVVNRERFTDSTVFWGAVGGVGVGCVVGFVGIVGYYVVYPVTRALVWLVSVGGGVAGGVGAGVGAVTVAALGAVGLWRMVGALSAPPDSERPPRPVQAVPAVTAAQPVQVADPGPAAQPVKPTREAKTALPAQTVKPANQVKPAKTVREVKAVKPVKPVRARRPGLFSRPAPAPDRCRAIIPAVVSRHIRPDRKKETPAPPQAKPRKVREVPVVRQVPEVRQDPAPRMFVKPRKAREVREAPKPKPSRKSERTTKPEAHLVERGRSLCGEKFPAMRSTTVGAKYAAKCPACLAARGGSVLVDEHGVVTTIHEC